MRKILPYVEVGNLEIHVIDLMVYVGYEGPIPLSFKLCYDNDVSLKV